jgi:hypothetical protein
MGMTDEAQPGIARAVKSLIQNTQPAMAIEITNTAIPINATKRNGTAENEVIPSIANRNILPTLYFVTPASRAFRS